MCVCLCVSVCLCVCVCVCVCVCPCLSSFHVCGRFLCTLSRAEAPPPGERQCALLRTSSSHISCSHLFGRRPREVPSWTRSPLGSLLHSKTPLHSLCQVECTASSSHSEEVTRSTKFFQPYRRSCSVAGRLFTLIRKRGKLPVTLTWKTSRTRNGPIPQDETPLQVP